jgi:hypothetical protein
MANLLAFAMVNHTGSEPGNPKRVSINRIWYNSQKG